MREALRHHPPRRHFLQPIVTNRRGGAQRLLGIAWLELDAARLKPSTLRRGVSPDAREAIGLQLHRDRKTVGARLTIARGARGQSHQVLHVMTELVSDDIGLGEITRRAEPL